MLLPKTIEKDDGICIYTAIYKNTTQTADSSYFAFSLKKFWFCVDKKFAAWCSKSMFFVTIRRLVENKKLKSVTR
jgi:hypothetical protein